MHCRAVPDYLHWHCTDMECVWWPSCCIPLRQHSSSRHRYRPTEWKSSCHPAAPTAPPQTHNLTLTHSDASVNLPGFRSSCCSSVVVWRHPTSAWLRIRLRAESSPALNPFPHIRSRDTALTPSTPPDTSRAEPSPAASMHQHRGVSRKQPCCARARMHADLKIKVRTGASCDSSSVPQQVAEVWVTGSCTNTLLSVLSWTRGRAHRGAGCFKGYHPKMRCYRLNTSAPS